jgi:hypothetical protein
MHPLIPINVKALVGRNFISLSRLRRGLLLIPLALACFALAPAAQAVCREGCSDTDNTFLGDYALLNNTTGFSNTAIGWDALLLLHRRWQHSHR